MAYLVAISHADAALRYTSFAGSAISPCADSLSLALPFYQPDEGHCVEQKPHRPVDSSGGRPFESSEDVVGKRVEERLRHFCESLPQAYRPRLACRLRDG